jgi:NTE family protein
MRAQYLRGSVFRCAIAAALMAATLAEAADTRPRIGLVLGGGGARGAAHIGVLEVLEKLHIPVDCVAGTSMGALVAGSYAAGLTPAVMRKELSAADWRDMFQDNPEYSELNYRNKKLSQRFLPGSETGVGENGLQYQSGVVSGQKVKLFFNHLVGSNVGERTIEQLSMPLSIIATDIGNGERVVFREGSLTTAMRASMSVPGLLAPVESGGRKLVDGGLVDNVPIREVRERCQADVVIAVNVGSPLLDAKDVGSLLSVSAQMVNILTEQNVSQSLASLKPSDIYIKPDLNGISAGDFHRHSETADRGRKAAEGVVEQLKRLSVSDQQYATWWAKIENAHRAVPRVDEIQIASLKHVNPASVERHVTQPKGGLLDSATLNRDLLRVYGDGYYESVDYQLLNGRERSILRIMPVEKSWGPDYMRFAINLDASAVAGATFGLRGAYHKTWLNSLGGELIVAVEIGERNQFGVDFYQPLDVQQRFYVESTISVGSESLNVFQNNKKIAEYDVNETVGTLALGANVGLLGQARLGWQEKDRRSALETGVSSMPNVSKRFGGWFASVDLEQMDRLYFPTKGWATKINYFSSEENDYSKIYAEARVAYPIGDVVMAGRVSYSGSPKGTLPTYDAASLGGIFNLSAFAKNQLIGDEMTFASLRTEKIIGRLPLGLRGDMRVGLALEAGKVNQRYTETELSGWQDSTSLYFGGETPLGPVYLGYAYSTSSDSSNIYLFLGVP